VVGAGWSEGDWLPGACRERGCRIRTEFSVRQLAHLVAHWHPDETTMAGVRIDARASRVPYHDYAPIRDELARVAHLPAKPEEEPAHGVVWFRKKTGDEVFGTGIV
jgi:hypothetical protein